MKKKISAGTKFITPRKKCLKKLCGNKEEGRNVEGLVFFLFTNNSRGLEKQQLNINYNIFEDNGNLYSVTTHFPDNRFRCKNVPDKSQRNVLVKFAMRGFVVLYLLRRKRSFTSPQ